MSLEPELEEVTVGVTGRRRPPPSESGRGPGDAGAAGPRADPRAVRRPEPLRARAFLPAPGRRAEAVQRALQVARLSRRTSHRALACADAPRAAPSPSRAAPARRHRREPSRPMSPRCASRCSRPSARSRDDGRSRLRRVHVVPLRRSRVLHGTDAAARQGAGRRALEAFLRGQGGAVPLGAGRGRGARLRHARAELADRCATPRASSSRSSPRCGGRKRRGRGASCSTRAKTTATASRDRASALTRRSLSPIMGRRGRCRRGATR